MKADHVSEENKEDQIGAGGDQKTTSTAPTTTLPPPPVSTVIPQPPPGQQRNGSVASSRKESITKNVTSSVVETSLGDPSSDLDSNNYVATMERTSMTGCENSSIKRHSLDGGVHHIISQDASSDDSNKQICSSFKSNSEQVGFLLSFIFIFKHMYLIYLNENDFIAIKNIKINAQ